MPSQLIQECPLTTEGEAAERVLEDPSPEGFKRQPSVSIRQQGGNGAEMRKQRRKSLWSFAAEFPVPTLHIDGRQPGDRLPDLASLDVGRDRRQMVHQLVPNGPLPAPLERPHDSIAGGLPVAGELGQEASPRQRPQLLILIGKEIFRTFYRK
jgi:hypothetical protein